MSHRHSDSKRRHSRFDPPPQPSPNLKSKNKSKSNRYRRDDGYGKEDRERVTSSANALNGDHEAPKHAPDTQQHDERGSAGQVGQSSAQRKTAERGWWKDSKNLLNERAELSHGREQRDEKSQAKLEDNTFQRRDGFSKRKDGPPQTLRKRPAFREKIPVDLGYANLAATVAVKSSQIDHPPERNERKGERSSNPHHLDRPEKRFADDRAPNKGEARRDGFPSRGRRYGGNDNYRGRDKFNRRQGYHPGNTRTEKWKHDLYPEVNKDPIPQNEDDQIAKLEALLAS